MGVEDGKLVAARPHPLGRSRRDDRLRAAPGGRIYERTSEGLEYEWGEVLAWEPPHRLAYLWHIAGDKSDATEVTITFSPVGDVTSVRIISVGRNSVCGGPRCVKEPRGMERSHSSLSTGLPVGVDVARREVLAAQP